MFTYFIQVQFCWIVFYIIYFLLLSRETFFKWNRFYLLSSLILGLLIPVNIIGLESSADINIWLNPVEVTAEKMTAIPAIVESADFAGYLNFSYLYLIGALLFALSFLIGLLKLYLIWSKAPKKEILGWKVVDTHGMNLPPFSFLRWIFMDLEKFDDDELAQVIRHEGTHLRQAHTLDIIFIESLKIVFWCSPVILFYKKSLCNQHEYLADEGVLRLTRKPAQYGRFLLQQVQVSSSVRLANHFIFSQIKKRIIMMTKTRSQRKSLLKYTIALPLLLLLTCIFADPANPVSQQILSVGDEFKNQYLADHRNPEEVAPAADKPGFQEPEKTVLENETILPNTELLQKDTLPILNLGELDEQPVFIPGFDSLYRYLGSHIVYPNSAREAGIEGMVLVGFVVEKDGSLSNIEITRGVRYPVDTVYTSDPITKTDKINIIELSCKGSLEAEAMRVIKEMPVLWAPGRKNGQPVRVSFHLPIKFKLT